MKTNGLFKAIGMGCTPMIGCWWLAVSSMAAAHCDTEHGPVILEARAALEKGDVTPMLKWIKKDQEAEIKRVFATVLAVRTKGPESKEVADRWFIETLVRLHRAGEGAPYSGIKDEPVDPLIAMAEAALEEGSADKMIRKIADHMAAVIGKKLDRVVEAAKHKGDSVEAGREFVDAYVDYMHYVENVHAAIAAQEAHRTAAGQKERDAHFHAN